MKTHQRSIVTRVLTAAIFIFFTLCSSPLLRADEKPSKFARVYSKPLGQARIWYIQNTHKEKEIGVRFLTYANGNLYNQKTISIGPEGEEWVAGDAQGNYTMSIKIEKVWFK